MAGRFGGLRVDRLNALDLVAGKLEIGAITESQAALLQQWLIDGYVILPGAIAALVVDAARADLDAAFLKVRCWSPQLLGSCGVLPKTGIGIRPTFPTPCRGSLPPRGLRWKIYNSAQVSCFITPAATVFRIFCPAGVIKASQNSPRRGAQNVSLEVEQHLNELTARARQQKLPKKTFLAKKGDVLIWHADLVHGGSPVSKD